MGSLAAFPYGKAAAFVMEMRWSSITPPQNFPPRHLKARTFDAHSLLSYGLMFAFGSRADCSVDNSIDARKRSADRVLENEIRFLGVHTFRGFCNGSVE